MIKVIIADDEKLVCNLVKTLADWDTLGMQVVGTAENGIEALEMIKTLEPDILITDIRMPGCDGLELIKRARELRPQLEIVIISGYAHFEYAKSAIRYRVGNYLLKPIKREELMDTLWKMKERCEARLTAEKEKTDHRNNQRDLISLRNGLMRDLLLPTPPVLSEEILEEKYHFNMQGNMHQAFLLKIDGDIQKIGDYAYNVAKEKIREVLKNTLFDVCTEYHLYFQDYVGYGILNYDEEQKSEIRKRLRTCLNQIDAQKHFYGMEFSLALGSVVDSCNELADSVRTAKETVLERFVEGSGRLLEGVPAGSGIDKQNLLDKYVKSIENAIEILSINEASEACKTLYQDVVNIGNICGREIYEMVLLAGRLFVVHCAVGEVDKCIEEFKMSCRQCCTVEELFEQIEIVQKEKITAIGEQRRNEEGRPVRVAKQYVKQHFQEPITLEEVSEAIGFSVSYFSVLFKKETGEGFAKYLIKVRMDEAKRLLRETNCPVAEICEMVGYSDRKHFTQTFNKATGLNPAEYRKLYG